MTIPRGIRMLLVGLVPISVLALAAAVDAQPTPLGLRWQLEAELGGRAYLTRPEATALAALEKYRDLGDGPVLPDFRLRAQTLDGRHRLEAATRWLGQSDQSFTLAVRGAAGYRFELMREQTPHIFSTNVRLPGSQTDRGVFALPTPRPDATLLNGAPLFGPVGVRWDTDRIRLALAPAAPWRLDALYSRTRRSGDRPMGMAFGTAGNNHREVLEPIEHEVHRVRIAPSWTRARYQLRLAYDFSAFTNELDAVIADNPLVAVDQAAAGSSRGRSALPPSNLAHGLGLSGGVSLPMSGRLAGTVGYGWRRQTHALLPYTINTAIDADALAALPASADGDVRTLAVSLTGSARPTRSVNLSARYRYYDLDDRTPSLALPGRIVSDRSVSGAAMSSHRYPFTRQNAGLELRWRPAPATSILFGYAWDGWKRDVHVREVSETSEHTPRVVADVAPFAFLGLRGAYSRGRRRGEWHEQVPASEVPSLRRFDVADRDRERFDLTAELHPLDGLVLAVNHARTRDDYPDSAHGLQANDRRSLEVDLSWSPSSRFTGVVSAAREAYRPVQRSRYRVPPTQLENESYDWIARSDDVVRTVGLALNATPIPRTLDVGVSWHHARTTLGFQAWNPMAPTGGTDAQNASAAASDFADARYRLSPGQAVVRYRITRTWVAVLRYAQERFTHVDFRTDGLVPATGADVLLGHDLEDYTARYVTFSFTYQPWIPGVRRPPY